ncbi:MAG: ABC transporter ATP-binding protein [Rhodothermia bacterium]|nr:MAG: ABC transporter ATP-binding protein [Rhodothermia bacterium]
MQEEKKTVIETSSITKVYATGGTEVHALAGVDFHVDEGEFVAIMGASGSGKSTLMNIVGCLDYPTSGTYLLDGIEVNTLGCNALADIRNQKIGFVFQGFNLLARTSALENVELPLLYDRSGSKFNPKKRALEALEMVGLADRTGHHPNELSGGQQQRVAIARALVTHPSLLLADEPTGNLDSKTSVDVFGLFQELNAKGITIVVVTHEPGVIQYVKRVVELTDGRVVRDESQTPRSAAEDLERILVEKGFTERDEELRGKESVLDENKLTV